MVTINAPAAAVNVETKESLLAYLDAMALAEPAQARLWQLAHLTLTQLAVLRELRQGPQSAGRLGERTGLAPASVTRMVDRLEKRGLVERKRSPEDRRSVEIHLEPAGERMLGEIRLLRGTPLHRAVESMTGEERRRLTASLKLLVAATRKEAAAEEDGD